MKLYDRERSGNAYKVRLLLALLDLEYERIPVDTSSGESHTDAFRKLNPRGQIPVLDDNGIIVWDSQAILVYLARRYADEAWLPLKPPPMAAVMQWLAVSENELMFGLAHARAAIQFGRAVDLAACQTYGRSGLAVMDQHLAYQKWLAAGEPSIADIACYPYVALAPEGDISLDDYPNVQAWIARIQALPRYVGMQGID